MPRVREKTEFITKKICRKELDKAERPKGYRITFRTLFLRLYSDKIESVGIGGNG